MAEGAQLHLFILCARMSLLVPLNTGLNQSGWEELIVLMKVYGRGQMEPTLHANIGIKDSPITCYVGETLKNVPIHLA